MLAMLSHIIYYKTNKNTGFITASGFLLIVLYCFQLATGLILSCFFYNNYSDISNFYNILFKEVHSLFASSIILISYIHMYKAVYSKIWINSSLLPFLSGFLLLVIFLETSFSGYLLPWGQMSFWGITVVTNMFSVIPFIGNNISYLIWGSFSINETTLNRFFSLHFISGLICIPLIFVHLILVHKVESTNLCTTNIINGDKFIFIYPKFYIKDFFLTSLFFIIITWIIFFNFKLINLPINNIPANPMVTPIKIVPEWYFLPVYCIIKYTINKILGILLSMIILFIPLHCVITK